MSPPALPPLPHTSHAPLPPTQVVILELLDHKPLLTGGYKAVLHIHSSELQGEGGAEGLGAGDGSRGWGPARNRAAQQLGAVCRHATAVAAALTAAALPCLAAHPPCSC